MSEFEVVTTSAGGEGDRERPLSRHLSAKPRICALTLLVFILSLRGFVLVSIIEIGYQGLYDILHAKTELYA